MAESDILFQININFQYQYNVHALSNVFEKFHTHIHCRHYSSSPGSLGNLPSLNQMLWAR